MINHRRNSFILGVLAENSALVRGVIEDYLQAQPEFPYLSDLVADYPRRQGGLFLAPSMSLLAVRVCDRPLEPALKVATSLVFFESSIQVHEDVAMGAMYRKGAPTLHGLYDTSLAINAGDALAVFGMRPLLDSRRSFGPRVLISILGELNRMARELVEGFRLEEELRSQQHQLHSDEAAYLAIALRRTSWPFFIGPMRIGSLVADRARIRPDIFMRFAYFLGAAFHFKEEVNRLASNPSVVCRSLAFVETIRGSLSLHFLKLRLAPPEVRRALSILDTSGELASLDEIVFVLEEMKRLGCFDETLRMAANLAGAAVFEAEHLMARLPPSRNRQLLVDLMDLWPDLVRSER